ncbi:transcription factor MYC2-like [Hordeum vulgare subsp. vulgare]|uniref:Transcription factor n=1 Tax=Hordeum vulgare subsp. vulgare TaxID=112509 RepID=A0A8I6YZL9_HORVV|nr:transcription factor MYC2-like [Hordeum vulgare subsp. vulgare]
MDDELINPCSSFRVCPPSCQFSTVEVEHHNQFIEFASCEVPEQWLLSDVVVPAKSDDAGRLWPELSLLSTVSDFSELPTVSLPASTKPQPAAKRQGRKSGTRSQRPNVSHVEAERKRRHKLNRRFCDLRAAVPNVSRMDKASLLADAVTCIAELRSRLSRLEDESKQAAAARWEKSASSRCCVGNDFQHHLAGNEAVEVRMLGREAAAVRMTTAAGSVPHAPARLMGAVRSLELHVHHACVSCRPGETVQDVVVDVPAALPDLR